MNVRIMHVLDGESYVGHYYVRNDQVHVSCHYGSETADLNSAEADGLARLMLGTIIRKAAAAGHLN